MWVREIVNSGNQFAFCLTFFQKFENFCRLSAASGQGFCLSSFWNPPVSAHFKKSCHELVECTKVWPDSIAPSPAHFLAKFMTLTRFLFFFHQISLFSVRYRSFVSFFLVLLGVLAVDIIFHELLYEGYAEYAQKWLGSSFENADQLDIGFTPEVWIALLSMVLGTLIIVISIASQSIPKLIDLYMEDWTSLFYVWFLIISGAHAAFIILYGEIETPRASSRVLNVHFLLTLCIVLAFPYIFYILKYTKPSNVINKIFIRNSKQIHAMATWRVNILMDMPALVEEFQFTMFEAMNQLDDLLAYVSFKEPKADIIQNMSTTVQQYIHLKSSFNPEFFKVSEKIRSDISFKTMIGQFGVMEANKTFFEQKCFRLMINMYIKLLEEGQTDLASLCVAEMSTIGQTAIEIGDDHLLEVIVVFFNTLLRHGIKHGNRYNEPRNLYNAAFHYGNFVKSLVEHKEIDLVQRCFQYFRMYGQEIFKLGRNSPSLNFIVHVFATEMRKALVQVYKDEWTMDVQTTLLNEFLQVDMPPEFDKDDLDRGTLMNNGVRWVQMGLALFYMKEWVDDFVLRIIHDVLDDLDALGEEVFRRVIEFSCFILSVSGPTFWEDTDRGNLNIYFTPEKDQIDLFKKRIYLEMQEKLRKDFAKKYRLAAGESELLLKLSKTSEPVMLSQIVEQVDLFEKALLRLEAIDKDMLTNLVSLREKLGFTSKNPQLRLTNTRQIAVHTRLEILPVAPKPNEPAAYQGVVAFSYLNYFYLRFEQEGDLSEWQSAQTITFHVTPPLQNRTYQFQSKFEGLPLENHLFKVLHVDNVEVIAEK